MKTLDEVIKANECCDHGEPDSRCEDCPYNGIGACCAERETDALHYLKEYQRYQNTPSRNGHMALVDYFEESQKNEPLSWDELRQMEGKPVWVEADDEKYKGWVIVGKFYSLLEKEDLDAHVDLYYFGRSMEYSKEMYGYYWQAYRKERV